MKNSFLLLSLAALPFACTPNDTVAREDASVTPDAPAPDAPAPDAPAPDAPAPDASVMCGNVPMPMTHRCAAATPTAEPGCRCVIGAYWNGSACAFLGGCRCTAGCDRVYPTMDACEAAHASCRADGGVADAAQDVGPDAAPDAGASFACGEMLRCQGGRQYCHETIPGVPGASRSFRCDNLPAGCSRCACIPDAMMPGAMCNESTPGELRVTIALP